MPKTVKNRVFVPDTPVHFTADTHFGHGLMIKRDSDDRPIHRDFRTIAEHDDALIENWNSVVDRNDTVFHLGDFCLKIDGERMRKIFRALHGKIHLNIGNHDWPNPEILSLPWASPPEHRRFVVVDQTRIVLDHYALRTWPGSYRGVIQLYGHSHGKLPSTDKSCDVGVDAWGLTPVTLPDIQRYLATQVPFVNQDSGEDEPEESAGFKL